MALELSDAAPQVLRDYYAVLQGGAAAFGDGRSLRRLLADDLDFTGPLAGHRPGAPDGFVRGVSGFVATAQSLTLVQEVHGRGGSAILYDAAMPGGIVRFAEFFTFRDQVILTLNLHYDGQDYLAKGGR